jgi:hypothetical protein
VILLEKKKKHLRRLLCASTATAMAAVQMLSAVPTIAAEETDDYVYCYASLTWAEYWENEGVYLSETADGDWSATSAELDTREESDLGAYDAVTRATSNHGLHRGSYQCTVMVYDTDGNAYEYTGKGQGDAVDVVKGDDSTVITVDGETVGTYDHSVNIGPKYVPVMVAASDYEAFKEKYRVFENGDTITSGYTEGNLNAISETVSVDENTSGLKLATAEADGDFSFAKRTTSETPSDQVVDASTLEISDIKWDSGYGDFIRVDINGDYGDLGAHMYAVRWDYYGDQDTVLATYGTKFAADNWMHKAMGIQLGLTESMRCALPEGYEDGAGRWDVTIYAEGYQDYTFTIGETAEDTDYVYGTINLPYADYYYGELFDVTEDATMQLEADDPTASIRAEGYYDAVTSATNTKSVKYGSTYYTANEDGSVTVNGIKDVAVAIPKSLYEEATAAIAAGSTCNNQLLNLVESFTVSESQETPTEYKVLNGDGTLTAMKDSNEAVIVNDANITVQTNTTYGNYQISVSDPDSLLPDSDNMEGVVITTSDGASYAMLHVDNLWLRTGEIAWAVRDNYLVHNANTLKYKSFVDTEGKTITSVRYIIRDGADVVFQTEAYLPRLHDGSVKAEDAAVNSGSVSVTLTDLPEDYVANVEMAKVEATYQDGVLTYDPTGVLAGKYTISISDGNGVYAPVSTSVTLTTDTMPATFDAATNSIVATADADAADFSNYLANLSTVTINGTQYNLSGKMSVKLIDSKTGALDLTATSKETPVFDGAGTYEVSLTSTGYTENLTFQVTIAAAEALGKGDVNADGAITVEDAVEILSYYAKESAGLAPTFREDADENATILTYADVDENGSITVEDAVMVLSYYAKQSAGLDVTWESLQ